MTNFDIIKSFSLEELANYLQNIQETALSTSIVDNAEDWKYFLEKESEHEV